MVSLSQRQEVARLASLDPQLERFRKLLNGESSPTAIPDGHDARAKILSAISADDAGLFKRVGGEIEARRISEESDWCHDDYLVFLLLLGNEKFGHPLKHLGLIIDARRNNNNPIPRRLNEVFAALDRQEFGIEGEFGFLKIPFLELLNKLHLTVPEAVKALAAMSESLNWENVSPFLQLLALKAHDIILTKRKPVLTEDAVQLVTAFETHAPKLTIGQWARVLWSLPGYLIVGILTIIAAIAMCPIFFSFGTKLALLYYYPSVVRPDKVSILEITPPKLALPLEVRQMLASREAGQSAPGKICFLEVQCAPFDHPTPAFAIEVSHSSKPIYDALAFLEDPSTRPSALTVVPQEWDQGRVRLLIPPQAKGQKLYIVVTFQVSPGEGPELIKGGIVLRPLE